MKLQRGSILRLPAGATKRYVRVGGAWAHRCRAVDEHDQVVDVLLRSRRDLAGVKAFFTRALMRRGSTPSLVVTNKHLAYPRAIREQLPERSTSRLGYAAHHSPF